MEHAEHGFMAAAIGLISGFVLSIVVSSVFPALFGESGRNLAVLINFLLIIIGVVELERAKYWGLLYSLGYFFGLILMGRYIMESWELIMYCIIVGLYIIQKVARKVGT
jgi:uncharacterized membrane protein